MAIAAGETHESKYLCFHDYCTEAAAPCEVLYHRFLSYFHVFGIKGYLKQTFHTSERLLNGDEDVKKNTRER